MSWAETLRAVKQMLIEDYKMAGERALEVLSNEKVLEELREAHKTNNLDLKHFIETRVKRIILGDGWTEPEEVGSEIKRRAARRKIDNFINRQKRK